MSTTSNDLRSYALLISEGKASKFSTAEINIVCDAMVCDERTKPGYFCMEVCGIPSGCNEAQVYLTCGQP